MGDKDEPNPKFGTKSRDLPPCIANESLAPWIFMVSKGGLTVPTNKFLLDVETMDKAFIAFHGIASFDKGSRIIDRFTEKLVALFAGNNTFYFLQQFTITFSLRFSSNLDFVIHRST